MTYFLQTFSREGNIYGGEVHKSFESAFSLLLVDVCSESFGIVGGCEPGNKVTQVFLELAWVGDTEEDEQLVLLRKTRPEIIRTKFKA